MLSLARQLPGTRLRRDLAEADHPVSGSVRGIGCREVRHRDGVPPCARLLVASRAGLMERRRADRHLGEAVTIHVVGGRDVVRGPGESCVRRRTDTERRHPGRPRPPPAVEAGGCPCRSRYRAGGSSRPRVRPAAPPAPPRSTLDRGQVGRCSGDREPERGPAAPGPGPPPKRMSNAGQALAVATRYCPSRTPPLGAAVPPTRLDTRRNGPNAGNHRGARDHNSPDAPPRRPSRTSRTGSLRPHATTAVERFRY